MKNICILGSTGSVGRNTLEIINAHSDSFNVVALSAHENHSLLIEQIRTFNPSYVSVGTEEGFTEIKNTFPELTVYLGEEGLKKLGSLDETDILLVAVLGIAGIVPIVEAIKKEKRIALANKETMVAGGCLINKLLKQYKAEIIPVDSEHSAIFQALLAGKDKEVSRIILTASGGPFRGKGLEELQKVSIQDALKHPTWSMGKKITIDSATLVNKGLEVIEAHQLFGIPYEQIEVVVHPQSIIHSMVEFKDKSVLAQMGVPDMKVPIQYALTYPERMGTTLTQGIDFKNISSLTFEQPDHAVFQGITLALYAGKKGKSMPIVFNAANEVAVKLFFEGKIKFLDIYKIIKEAMDEHEVIEADTFESIIKVDKETREKIKNKLFS